jgi:hypothetical protein
MKSFAELTEGEMLALAISNREEDGRVYADFAKALREDHPDSVRGFSSICRKGKARNAANSSACSRPSSAILSRLLKIKTSVTSAASQRWRIRDTQARTKLST